MAMAHPTHALLSTLRYSKDSFCVFLFTFECRRVYFWLTTLEVTFPQFYELTSTRERSETEYDVISFFVLSGIWKMVP